MHPEEVRSATARGYGSAWQKARKRFLALHPLCVECMKEGRYVAATDVDHIIPHRGNRELFWNMSNGVELEPKFVDVAVERYRQYVEENNTGGDIYLIRNGQRLTYDEVLAEMEGLHE